MAIEGGDLGEHANWQEDRGWMNDGVRASIKREYRNIRKVYGVNDERTQRAKMRYLQRKDETQRLIGRIIHKHNSVVMRMLNEYASKKRMFNHIKMLMRKEERMNGSIQVFNESVDTVSDAQEVERFVQTGMRHYE